MFYGYRKAMKERAQLSIEDNALFVIVRILLIFSLYDHIINANTVRTNAPPNTAFCPTPSFMQTIVYHKRTCEIVFKGKTNSENLKQQARIELLMRLSFTPHHYACIYFF